MNPTLSITERERILKLARAASLERGAPKISPIVPVERGGRLALSFAQQRLWFLEQLGELGSTYHIPMRLRLQGALDRAALARTLERIVARHESLRTVFVLVDGEPEQRILPVEESGFGLMEHDLRGEPHAEAEVERLMTREADAPFDLARGPLVRARLVRVADDDHLLLLTMHHVVSDAWSMGVFTQELSTLYTAFSQGQPDPLPALPVQYADYAAWQRHWLEGEVLDAQAAYWTQTLAGAPELLELPTDHARPARQDHAGAILHVELGRELTAGLTALSHRHGTTLYMTLLAGWAVVLARLSGQDDVVIGTPSANRARPEVEELIGFFVNTLALRVDLSARPAVAELLAQVKTRALEGQRNQDIPFEQVVERLRPARSLAHSPLFQVMFAWQNAAGGALELPGLSLAPADSAPHVTAKFDLLLSLGEADGQLVGAVEYATALFDGETVERWVGYLRAVLEAMAADDGRSVDRFPILPPAERALVLREWNATEATYPREACVHDLFEAQAARTPGAVAVVFEGERVAYAELNARANRLAHHLRALGVGPDARVGICVDRSVEMVVGLLGILKAGGAYVPLDASYPVDRLRFMLEDSAPAVLLTHPPLAATVAELSVGSTVPVLDLTDVAAWAAYPETNPDRGGAGPGNLAHVLFTSGSTGRPKGVMLQHGSLVNRLAWMQDRYGMETHEALLQKTPFSFDVSFWEFFWPLMVGARLVMARPGGHRDPAYLAEVIRREGITTAHFVPSMLQLFLEHPEAQKCTGLLRVPVSGEAISAALVRQFHERLPGVGLFNQYGPTESGEVTEWACDPDAERVSIGRAIHNSAVYVLDRAGEPVPVGVAGELFIGGVAVARGYLGRPRLTGERFVPDPFGEPGARLYRTGDLCRWLPDGTLEYLGRTDFQVKVRGFRVELGEIEARLASHPGVREAVALALDDGAGGKRLVAYFVGDALESEALRAHLSEQLPEYMVPAAFVRLDAFPVTPNGKLDRRALPAPEGDAFAAQAYEAPVGETEEALAEIWAELLGVERVGRGDDFFALGGHSLLAVRVVSRVRQALGVEAGIGDLFVRPVLADFARGLQRATGAEGTAIVPVERGGPLALSFAQQRLWFIEQMEGAGAAYHLPMRLRLKGELDREALTRALERIVARHEVLRTSFPETDGVPAQRISAVEESPFHLVEHDLEGRPEAPRELGHLVADEASAPFDLARGPLFRGRLIRLAGDDHVLLITMHHIVSDGWSLGIFTRELSALYGAFRGGGPDPLPPLPVQYADYAAWQRRWVEGEVLQRQADYWRETLSGAPELLELPTDHVRPARQDFAGAWVEVELDEALTAALKTLGQRHGATLHMTLLAGWAAVLARLSGQDEVVVGTPSANRGQSEIEGLIGFFVNTLALRVDLSGSPSVAELLGRVKERSLGAQHHQDIPFEQVVELVQPARSLAHTPLFQVMFAWQNAPGGSLELPGLALGPLDSLDSGDPSSQVAAKFDLSLALWEDGGRIEGVVEYATALFERETVERWLGYLRRVLEGMAADERGSVERLELLPDAEQRRVVEEFNATDAAFSASAFVHEQFEAQVDRTPGAAALVFEDETLSYAELNARANRLAHHLRSLGVGPETRVGICVQQGPGLVVGVLAVLKAGGAYLPLDPAYPGERLRYMLEDGAPAALLTEPALRPLFAAATLPVLELGAPGAAWDERPASNPGRGGLTAEHLAYVIYTSGSTGRPKGVRVPHGSLGATLAVAGEAFGFGAGDRVPSLASFAFDIWLFETLLPLLGGGTVRLVPRERVPDVPRLVEDLAWCTVVHAVPALMRRIVEEVRATPEGVLGMLRHAFVGGDAVAPDLLEEMRAAFPAAEIHVLYGPTEAAIICAAHRLGGEAAARQMVGRPLGNAALYVVEPGGRVAPVGVAGELCLGGASVARDYLGRPGLTAERFVPDPFASEPGARLYRTGDRVRWVEASAEVRTGVLEFLGRTDHQVKVRGFRIEPGEIEARLAEHPGVREAVVLVREDAQGEKRLVAYVAGDETAGADVLRAHLSERLPEYMVPAAYVRLDALPLTPNGKVDRKALPAPEGDAFPARGYEAPSGRVEEAVAAIWAELLGAERVGRRDHFFELGGHSLLAVRVVSRVRQALGVEASPRDVFERPVLADFARGLETAARAEAVAIEPVDRAGPLALSFAQQRLWFLEQLGNLGSTYHIPMRLRLRGELDRGALVRSLDRIVARHEALRTSFPTVEGEPVQHIVPVEESGFRLVEHDLRASAGAEDELRRLVQDEANAPFDLAQGPLFRGRLVRMAADDNVLLLTIHHVVSDGWSTGVLFRELAALYTALTHGEPDPLPPLPLQYADYATWHRRWVEGPVLEAQAEYWTETLAGAPELLELPTDHARPAKQDFAGASVNVELDEALTAALKSLSQRHGTTLFMTLLAGWAAVLARLSGQDDVVIGTPSANRGHAEVEELIGFFVNTLPLRVDLSGTPTVAGLLDRVRSLALEAQRNQDIPFEQVVERIRPTRSLAHSPLFQVMFAWQNAPGQSLELPGLALGPLDPAGSGDSSSQVSAKYDLSLSLWEHGGRIEGSLEYATALFDGATVERHVGYLRRMLEAMAADDATPLDRLDLLSAAERRLVVDEWNRTDADLPAAPVHRRFEAQVEKTPGATAVVSGADSLTYAELNARANRLARWLRRRGVGAEVRVGLCLERGPEMVVAVLGVLKAGGAYVPLDPSYPAERLAYMAADSDLPVVLTQERLLGRLPFDGSVEVVALDARWGEIETGDATDPAVAVDPRSLAYVLYTSGSTGRPKGVAVEHTQLGAYLAWATRTYPGGGSALHSSLSFDLTVTSLFVPLLGGGTVEVVEEDDAVEGLARLLERGGREMLKLTPAHLRILGDQLAERGAVGGAACLVVGGEPLIGDQIGFWIRQLPETVIVNEYGPTETVVGCSIHSQRLVETGAGQVPIGRPVANTRIYVLDARGEPVPVGVPGELYVGGAQVTRGYLGRPGLTAERFVPDPIGRQPGARIYRTGDRARWRTDGTLEYLGRLDEQVKIRGFRIEPGEVEAALLEHEGVRECAVLVREDAGEKRLVAYVAGGVEADELREHLRRSLPEYMVPAAFVVLDALPLTPNGKLDRKALPAPEFAADADRYVAPRTPAEEVLAGIWAEVLKVERVGVHDNFFALGGHSLLAVTLVERMRRRGVRADVRALFTTPTVAELAASAGGDFHEVAIPPNRIPAGCGAITPEMLPLVELTQAEIDRVVGAVPGGAANVQDVYPLAPLQEGILFHHLLIKEGDPYLLSLPLAFESRERLDAYLAALQAAVARHDILRTAVVWEGLSEPVQVVWRHAPVAVEEVEVDPAAGDAAKQLYERFDPRHHRIDLSRAPMLRAYVTRDVTAERWVLLLLQHHLTSDHTALDVLRAEIDEHLDGRADQLPAPLPFRNYVAQARLGVSRAEHEAFFRELLGDVDEPTAPFGLREVHGDGLGLEEGTLRVEEELGVRLRERARRLGVSVAAVCHVAWAQVLARTSGRDDVVFGTVLFGRMQGGEGADRVLGPFINTLPIRIRVAGGGAVTSVRRTQALLASLVRHEHASLALAQQCSGVQAPEPLFSALFNYRHVGGGEGKSSARGPSQALRVAERSNYPLTLSVNDWGEEFSLSVQVEAEVGAERVCALMHTALAGLVEALEEAPERPLRNIEVLPQAERRQVLEAWNRTEAEYPADRCIHELFQAQVERTPGAVAVSFEGERLTYAELNARANRLAHHLRALGVGPEVRVAVCVKRGLETVVALLAVLKTGGAYVPLDPGNPEDRLRYALGDSAPAALLTGGPLVARFADAGIPIVDLDAPAAWDACPASDPGRAEVGVGPEHLAYVIYTSGSTGRPKGVLVRHGSLVSLVAVTRAAFGVGPGDVMPALAASAFDISLFEFFLPLVSGAEVRMVAPARVMDARVLLGEITDATLLHAVPALMRDIAQVERLAPRLTRLRGTFVGGDQVPADLLAEMSAAFPAARTHVLYGPTEATILASAHAVPADGAVAGHPIGRPLGNVRLYVCDALGEPQPVGVAGELLIGGMGVARGYLGRPALTAERFVPDPFSAVPGARLYRSGDRARWREESALVRERVSAEVSPGSANSRTDALTHSRTAVLEFLGRTDFQVKIRGFRIELGEIEAGLRSHDAVRDAVVLAREDAPGKKRLVAYVVGEVAADALKAHLEARVPGYMVPAAYVRMEALPLTSNGKLDRRALPVPDGAAYARRGHEPPRTMTEQVLATIWCEVLGVKHVGRRDHFFDLGGHSLLAVRMVARVREALNPAATVDEVFAHPTLYELAARLQGDGEWYGSTHAIPVRKTGSERPLFVAHDAVGIVFYGQILRPHLDPEIPVYALPGPLNDTDDLASLDDVVTRLVRMITEVQPEGPYRVAGWSAGGVFAYAVAERLVMEGRAVEFVGLLDAVHPAHLPPPDSPRERQFTVLDLLARDTGTTPATPEALQALREDTEGLDLPAFIAACKARGLLPEAVTVARAEQVDSRIALLKSSHSEFVPGPLPISVHIFSTDDAGDNPHRGWENMPGGAPFRLERVPGTHHTMWKKGNVEMVGEVISRAIRASAAGGG